VSVAPERTPTRQSSCRPRAAPPLTLSFARPFSRKKNQAPGQKTRRYKRDIDQIHEDLKDNGALKMSDTLQNKDVEDLPGSSSSQLSVRASLATPAIAR
jgi:hypothetical protein